MSSYSYDYTAAQEIIDSPYLPPGELNDTLRAVLTVVRNIGGDVESRGVYDHTWSRV